MESGTTRSKGDNNTHESNAHCPPESAAAKPTTENGSKPQSPKHQSHDQINVIDMTSTHDMMPTHMTHKVIWSSTATAKRTKRRGRGGGYIRPTTLCNTGRGGGYIRPTTLCNTAQVSRQLLYLVGWGGGYIQPTTLCNTAQVSRQKLLHLVGAWGKTEQEANEKKVVMDEKGENEDEDKDDDMERKTRMKMKEKAKDRCCRRRRCYCCHCCCHCRCCYCHCRCHHSCYYHCG